MGEFKDSKELADNINKEVGGDTGGFTGFLLAVSFIIVLNYILAPFVLSYYNPSTQQGFVLKKIVTYTYVQVNPGIGGR